MIRPAATTEEPMQALRKVALGYPEAEEGISCDKAAFKARSRAFLFMGSDDKSYHALLKLGGETLEEAGKLAAKQPHHFKVGGHDWVTATFGLDQSPPEGLLEKWIDESYRLLAPKQLVAKLRPNPSPALAEPQHVPAQEVIEEKKKAPPPAKPAKKASPKRQVKTSLPRKKTAKKLPVKKLAKKRVPVKKKPAKKKARTR